MKRTNWLDFDDTALRALVDAARDPAPVVGLTHNHYKYPARFSPQFASAAIDAFTKPGDLIFDPFMGGGTTLVEALARGRRATGIDISSLATFVAETKTLILKDAELEAVRRWATRLPSLIDMHLPSTKFPAWEEAGYYRNLNLSSNWRLTKAIGQALASSERLRARRAKQLARCVILRTAQWALDGRKKLPTIEQFRSAVASHAAKMVEGAEDFRRRQREHRVGKPRLFNKSVVGITKDEVFAHGRTPKLVLTSPPYPGIHVLYHRWQVDGRKETPAPFWIANKLDGVGLSHYTMGDRKNPGLRTYFENMQAAFNSISLCLTRKTIVVQMVAFSDPDTHLPRYLEMMEAAGFAEQFIKDLESTDNRLWRMVPSRRWYANQRGKTGGSQEVVLFHKLVDQQASVARVRRDATGQSPSI